MNEILLSSEELIPDILFSAHKFMEQVAENAKTYFEKIKETGTQDFYSKYNLFITNGWNYVKTGLGDLCVGLKAFGEKLSPLGGEAFVNLGNTTSNIINITGELFNYMDNFIIQINELMQENSDISKFDELSNSITSYFSNLASELKSCSIYCTHLYGDAKFVLGESFNNLSEGLIRFIQNVKLKCIVGIATVSVGLKIAYDYLSENKETVIYNGLNLVQEDKTVSMDYVKQLLDLILSDLEQAKMETLKNFGIS